MSLLGRYGDGEEGVIASNVSITNLLPLTSPGIMVSDVIDVRAFNGIGLMLFSDVNAGLLAAATFAPTALSDDLAGAWVIEVSNDYTPAGSSSYGQIGSKAGRWVDITSQFSPTIATVAPATIATTKQYVQASPLDCRSLRVRFVRSGGTGTPTVIAYAKTQG